MKSKIIIPLLLLLSFTVSLEAQQYDLVAVLKRSVEATEINLNNLSQEVRSNTVFNGDLFKSSYPNAKNEELNRYFYISCNEDTTLAKQMLIELNLFCEVRVSELSYTQICTDPTLVDDPEMDNADYNYPIEMIEANCAWTITTGNPEIHIGIADTEFQTTHPDLIDKIIVTFGPETDEHMHGTSVASVAAADTDNGIGISGVGFDCSLELSRVAHTTEGSIASATSSAVSNAIWSLYQNGVKIINVSWTGTGLNPIAAQEITENGTTLILAAGNTPDEVNHNYIANIPGVIMVSGVDINRNHGPTNNAHNEYVDLCAPSVNIRHAMPDDNYATNNGTSLAAPMVAGTVGLMLSVNPCLTPSDIETIIKTTTTSINDGSDYIDIVGTGILNTYEAVLQAQELAENYQVYTQIADEYCLNELATLGSTIIEGSDYTWTYMDAEIGTGNTYTIVPSNLGTYTYTLSYTSFDGCSIVNDYILEVLDNTCECGEYYHADNPLINTDQEWTIGSLPTDGSDLAEPGVFRINTRLLIESGNTLTIGPDVRLEFGPYGRITVDKGAKLIVNGATITKACNEYWYGIEVVGEDSLNQSNSHQGKVILNEGTRIEYAKNGVTLIEHDEDFDIKWGSAGGVLIADNTTFYNCRRGVEFMKYQNFHGSTTTFKRNLSSIKNCEFIIDDGINNTTFNDIDDEEKLRGITLWGVDGVKIKNCQFKNQIFSSETDEYSRYEGIGILSVDANYSLLANYQGPIYPNEYPEEYYNRSAIENFQYGLKVQNSDELTNVRIDRVDFNENTLGVSLTLSNNTRLTRNNFIIGEPFNYVSLGTSNIVSAGAYFNDCSGYVIQENSFVGTPNIERLGGLIIEDSGSKSNMVYKNTFDVLGYGTLVYGVNNTASIPEEGLQIKCNDYGQAIGVPNNYRDIYLHADATISTIQGAPTDHQSPAGNRFFSKSIGYSKWEF